jgi:DNA-directed RNA polymerase specialized sigma24 family protein
MAIEGLELTAPMDTDLYLSLEPLVNAIASQEWKRSHIFSIDDVAQAIWLHMMENWTQSYEGKEEGLVKHMARRAARKYCQKQRTEHMYTTGAFLYTPAMVRRYLEDDVVWCGPEDCKDIEARVDISEAFKKLTKGQKAIVYKRYALREPLANNAETVAESRAVSRITDILNTGLRLEQAFDQ